jgi:phosphoribosylpyrophosphate synthetase
MIELKRFSDGEIWVKYGENIRGLDVFIIQSTNPPAENWMELLIMIDAAKRASAKILLLLFRILVMQGRIEKISRGLR